MARYFFNFKDGRTHLDDEGLELSGLDEVRVQAVVASGEMLRDYAGKFWGGTEWRMWVTDEAGATVCALKFSAE
jgi:hypothetical protein